MGDRHQHLTARETEILRGLGPHTRGHALQLLANYPSLTITSGRRTPAHNRRVGGSPTSYHLRGRGVDFAGPYAVMAAARSGAKVLRLGERCTGPEEVILEDDHLHVAW